MAKKNWIQGAIKHPGALGRSVSKKDKTKRGTIKVEALRRMAKKGGKTGARARLALTFRKMHRRRK